VASPNGIPKADGSGKLEIGWLPLHKAIHQHGGQDEIGTATAAANAIPKATTRGKLSHDWLPSLAIDNSTYSLVEQFTTGAGLVNGQSLGQTSFYSYVNISGTATPAGAQAPTSDAIGIWRIGAGSASGSNSLFRAVVASNTALLPAADATTYTYETRFALGSDRSSFYAVGLIQATSTPAGFGSLPGAWCEVTHSDTTARTWSCYTRTTVISGPLTGATANTNYHILKITVDSTMVRFYMDGVEIGNGLSTNIPTFPLSPGWETKTNTTGPKLLDLDAWRFVK
jgi:hypothetical protein